MTRSIGWRRCCPTARCGWLSREAIEQAAEGIAQRLILCGHSHLARAVRLSDGRLVVNPGSVGSPGYRDIHPYPHVVEAGTPDARYAILELADESWRVTFRHVPYDHERWRHWRAATASRNWLPRWRRAGSGKRQTKRPAIRRPLSKSIIAREAIRPQR